MNFQQTFAAQIAGIIHQAYNSGLLQYHPMVIVDITVTMNMHSNFNQLALQFNGRLLSASIYDADSEDAQAATIENLVTDIIK